MAGNPAWAGGAQGGPVGAGIAAAGTGQGAPADTGIAVAGAGPVSAGIDATGGGQGAGITLEQAIEVAKQFVQAPDDYTNFQPNYYENEQQGAFWDLQWNNGTSGSGSIEARVNAATGELWGLNRWQPAPPGSLRHGQAKLSRAAGRAAAEAWFESVLPKYYGHLQPNPQADQVPYIRLNQGATPSYSYSFIRIENGIPFPENGATIQIDATSGAVDSFTFDWDLKLELPDAGGVLPPDQAVSLWKANAKVGLEYFLPQANVPLVVGKPGTVPARLLYVPKNAGIMIDARTGEILKPGVYLYGLNGGEGMGDAQLSMKSAARANVPLTPAEQQALVEMGKLISRDRALAIAQDLAPVPSGYRLQSSSLNQEYLGSRRIWSFYWQQESEKGQGFINSLSVDIDAGNGQLVGFSLSTPQPEQQAAPTLDEAQARDLANQFLARVAGDYLKQLESLKTMPAPPIIPLNGKQQAPTSFSFTGNRLVNGIPFGGNGVNVTVDAVQGRVTYYRLNWWDLQFPEARGVITRARAEEVFLGASGMELTYVRQALAAPGQDPASVPVRLVYELKAPAPAYVDSFSGLALGEDFQPQLHPDQQAFSDLAGQPAAEAVNLLVDSRIIPVYGTDFQPQARLSCRDWLIWLVRADGWQQESSGDPDRDYGQAYQQALAQGILKPGEQYQPQADLDKATMARLLGRALGWDEIAGFQGVWAQPPALSGTAKVAGSDLGYLSLAQGLGIVDMNDKSFDPASGLTRAEGALALYKILN
jgi:hypothetical protein